VKKRLHFESKIGTAQKSKQELFKSSPVVEIDIIRKYITVEVEI